MGPLYFYVFNLWKSHLNIILVIISLRRWRYVTGSVSALFFLDTQLQLQGLQQIENLLTVNALALFISCTSTIKKIGIAVIHRALLLQLSLSVLGMKCLCPQNTFGVSGERGVAAKINTIKVTKDLFLNPEKTSLDIHIRFETPSFTPCPRPKCPLMSSSRGVFTHGSQRTFRLKTRCNDFFSSWD